MLKIKGFAMHRWYPLLIALLACIDAFIVFIPNEALLISAILALPKHWIRTTLWVSIGSAIGAAIFGLLASAYGESFVGVLFPSLLRSKAWLDSVHMLQHHGYWGLAVVSLSPLPQHAAVAIAGFAHLSGSGIFLAVFFGRLVKYLFVAWCCLHAPGLLRRLPIPES